MRYLTVFLILCLAAPAWAGDKSVFLYNPIAKELRSCQYLKSKYEYYKSYDCKNSKTGEKAEFDKGKDWILLEPVCFSDKRDNLKSGCLALRLGDGKAPEYLCFDSSSKKYISFDPKSETKKQWKEIPGDAPECLSSENEENVIKYLTFEINGQTDEEPGDAGKKEDRKK